MRVSRAADECGFTLVELLVGLAVALLLLGGLVALLNPAVLRARVQPEAIDLQQRLRAGSRSLELDLRAAGAGLHIGPHAGSLRQFLPPVLPRRIGSTAADPPDVARQNAISMLSIPADAVETALAVPLAGATATLQSGPGCQPAPACGFAVGTGLLLLDPSGQFDVFTVTSISGTDAQIRSRGLWPSVAYTAGAVVSELAARTYYLDASTRQLHLYDTDLTDVVILDDVTGFVVEYFGTPEPPATPRPTPGTANCLYDATGARLPASVLTADAEGLAALPLAIFVDGPWCGAGANRFDADLLRVRRVRVSLTGQVASASARGRGAGFAVPGTSRSAWSWEPDLTLTVDVAPPNLDLE